MLKRFVWSLLGTVILCAIILVPALAPQGYALKDATVRLVALNVSKADSLILQAGGRTYLMDTGTAQSTGRVIAALEALEITHLDGIFITHTDKDHAGGLAPLMDYFERAGLSVDAIYAPKLYYEKKPSKHPAYVAATDHGMEVTWLMSGDVITLDDETTLGVLGPIALDENDENNNSLVMVLESPHGRMLLTGDMAFDEEQTLLDLGLIPTCQVLKVAYHGGDDATSKALLEAVKPSLAVISTNTQEREETPSPKVLSALKEAGASVYETQQAQGGILVTLYEGSAQAQAIGFKTVPQEVDDLSITALDKEEDLLTLYNPGSQAISLAGWYVCSSQGDEWYFFPENAVIEPGESLTLGTLSTSIDADYYWPGKNVWHDKKTDTAQLYDPWGRLVSQFGNDQ